MFRNRFGVRGPASPASELGHRVARLPVVASAGAPRAAAGPRFGAPGVPFVLRPRVGRRLAASGLLALGLGCAGGDEGEGGGGLGVPSFQGPPPAGEGAAAPGSLPPQQAPGTGAAASQEMTGVPGSGVPGSGVPGSGASGSESPPDVQGGVGGSGPGPQQPSAGGSSQAQGQAGTPMGEAGAAGSSLGMAGSGGMEPEPLEPGLSGIGRTGAEECPAGPFGDPVPANVQIQKLLSVGENNFFNFEGPVWVGDALLFSEIGGGGNPPPSNINRFTLGGQLERGVFTNTGTNGLALAADGNLVGAAHDVGALSLFTLPGGGRSALGAQTFNGNRFNSPNDVVVRSDGNAYFTDPTFQAPGNPQGAQRVYRIAPDGQASVVDENLNNPNGITLSLDGDTLFVTTGSGFFRYALDASGASGSREQIPLQQQLETPDGMTVDCAGNLYTTEHNAGRIRVFDPEGNEIDRFGGMGQGLFDRGITNLAFGGPDRTTLFVTTLTQGDQGGLFAVELNVPGLAY